VPPGNWTTAEGQLTDHDSYSLKIPMVEKHSPMPRLTLQHLEVGGIGLYMKAQLDENI